MGTPVLSATQVAKSEGDGAESSASPSSRVQTSEYFSYSLPNGAAKVLSPAKPVDAGRVNPDTPAAGQPRLQAEFSENSIIQSSANGHIIIVPLRSQPASIVPIRNNSGTVSYRVLVSIGGKQRKKHFLNLQDAEAQQQMWEMERIHGAAASSPKRGAPARGV